MITLPSDTLTETARTVSQNDLSFDLDFLPRGSEGLLGTCGYSVSTHDARTRSKIYKRS